MITETKPSGPTEVLEILNDKSVLFQVFEKWMKDNASDINFSVIEMNLPSQAPGITGEDGIYLNKNWLGSMDLQDSIFPIVHEIGHAKEYENRTAELDAIMSDTNFESFFNSIVEVEKRVDDYAEEQCEKINNELMGKFGTETEMVNIQKQPLDNGYMLSRYKMFIKQNHDFWLNNRDKYVNCGEAIQAMVLNH